MKTVEAGMQGQIPVLSVTSVDPTLPTCGKLVGDLSMRCTRKTGHYGPCGYVNADGQIVMQDAQ